MRFSTVLTVMYMGHDCANVKYGVVHPALSGVCLRKRTDLSQTRVRLPMERAIVGAGQVLNRMNRA